MRTPRFWSSVNLLSNLLLPLSSLYGTGSTLWRATIPSATLTVPVICIGNLMAGGSGKTPVALAIGRILKERGVNAFFLSRGYGGKLKGPVLVDTKKHTACEVGDEPLLLAETLPTVVSKDRALGGRYAIHKGAKIIVMDDGFQNPSVAKTLSLVVIDGKIGFGNGRLLPAGPLRETPETGLRRAHGVIVVNRTTAVPRIPPDTPVFIAHTQPKDEFLALKDQKVVAFCGIAYPQKFFDTLAGAGANVLEKIIFADHHLYTERDLKKLIVRAHDRGALLVSTAKDAARVPPHLKKFVYVADITAIFDNRAAIDGVLDYALQQKK